MVKYKTEAGALRYTIRPLDVELSFDKACCPGSALSSPSFVDAPKQLPALRSARLKSEDHLPTVQGFYMFVRAVQLLTQRNDGTIVVRRVYPPSISSRFLLTHPAHASILQVQPQLPDSCATAVSVLSGG